MERGGFSEHFYVLMLLNLLIFNVKLLKLKSDYFPNH